MVSWGRKHRICFRYLPSSTGDGCVFFLSHEPPTQSTTKQTRIFETLLNSSFRLIRPSFRPAWISTNTDQLWVLTLARFCVSFFARGVMLIFSVLLIPRRTMWHFCSLCGQEQKERRTSSRGKLQARRRTSARSSTRVP